MTTEVKKPTKVTKATIQKKLIEIFKENVSHIELEPGFLKELQDSMRITGEDIAYNGIYSYVIKELAKRYEEPIATFNDDND